MSGGHQVGHTDFHSASLLLVSGGQMNRGGGGCSLPQFSGQMENFVHFGFVGTVKCTQLLLPQNFSSCCIFPAWFSIPIISFSSISSSYSSHHPHTWHNIDPSWPGIWSQWGRPDRRRRAKRHHHLMRCWEWDGVWRAAGDIGQTWYLSNFYPTWGSAAKILHKYQLLIFGADVKPCLCVCESNAVLISRPDKSGRTRISGHLGKITRITPGFLWFCPDFCDLVHVQSVMELFAKPQNTGLNVP